MTAKRKIIIITLLSLSICFLAIVAITYFIMTDDAKLDESLLPAESDITYYDINNEPISAPNYATLNEISDNIINAFVSVEDKRFYKHHGVDLKRIAGAVIQNIKAGSVKQGGSTITCQLIKNTHLTSEKTLKRKMSEAKIAIEAEKRYSKDQILEMYLNVIYFGNGIYGIKQACKSYFNKSPDEINPREAATLAAIIANPAAYSPTKHRNENQRRATMILGLMRDNGYLSDDSYESSINNEIIIDYRNNHNNYSRIYYNSMQSELSRINVPSSKRRNLRVYTYLDKNAEAAVEKSIRAFEEENDSPIIEILLVNNEDGGIITYLNNKENRPTKRQPGSLLKPFIYATAIQEGQLLPASPILDEPKSFNGYTPMNYKNISYGWVDADFALSHSLNVPAVALLEKVGIEKAYSLLNDTGISLSDSDKNLALALGGTTYGSFTKEICEGYMTLANMGTHKETGFIRKILDRNGATLYKRTVSTKSVLPQDAAYLTTSMLQTCAKSGTAKQLSSLPFSVASKTGTVAAKGGNDAAWCAGYTTKHTFVCRFCGKSRKQPLRENITGGNLPTKAIRSTLKALYRDSSPEDFRKPSTVKTVSIDRTVKQALHKLIPVKQWRGEEERILTTSEYSFDIADPDELFFKDLFVTQTEKETFIRCKQIENIEYSAYLNGEECRRTKDGFLVQRQPFPLAKLELICSQGGTILYRKSKIIKVGQSLITSTEASASPIRAS